jgi:hypothetical protein
VRLLSSARRIGTALVAGVVLAVLSPGTAHASGTEAFNEDFPDPFILPVTVDGATTYYAYATNTKDVYAHVQMMSSPDLQTWSPRTDALKALPKWAVAGYTWAPSVLAVGGKHVLYYTARERKSNKQCISRALSTDGPDGPFVDSSTGPMICQHRLGGSIDPDPFLDPKDGALYLHWKSDDNAVGGISKLWGQKLTSDGLGLSNKAQQLMKYDREWEKPLIEAPQMLRVNDSGYHLFYSGNWWESEHAAIGYGICTGPLSGCEKKTLTAPWLAKDTDRVGTAGQTFFTKPDGSRFVAYHAWDDAVGYGNGGKRSLWMNSVSFTADGTPVLGD